MYKSILSILIITIGCSTKNEQSKTLQNTKSNVHEDIIIESTIDKIDYYYIPEAALKDSIKGILINFDFQRKRNQKRLPVVLSWNSLCGEGNFNLTITPEQIFFSSSHENPNPNYLYWILNIDSTKYHKIRNEILIKPPKGFVNDDYGYYLDTTLKDSWPPKEGEWELFCEEQIQSQLKKFQSILNEYISNPNLELNLIKINSSKNLLKLFSSSKNEIMDWAPLLRR